MLDSITLTDSPTPLCEDAGRLDPTILGTLKAIHLAAASDLGDDLQAIVTYDDRLDDAALSNGVVVLAPS